MRSALRWLPALLPLAKFLRAMAAVVLAGAITGCSSAPRGEPWSVQLMGRAVAVGCEDVAFTPDGDLVTGDALGRIVVVSADDTVNRLSLIAQTGGRPLGVARHPWGVYIVADADRGLLSVAPDGVVRSLVESHDGEPLVLTNGVAIDDAGAIYFTESSRRHDLSSVTIAALRSDATGRLFRYDLMSRHVEVIAGGFVFANGVTVVDGGDAVIVAETFAQRLTKVHVRGERTGERELYADDLPGYVDNLSTDDRGLVWAAIYGERSAAFEFLRATPLVPLLLSGPVKAAEALHGGERFEPEPIGRVMAFDATGRIVHDLRDPTGAFAPVTGVRAHGDWLYLSSIRMPAIGRMPRPAEAR